MLVDETTPSARSLDLAKLPPFRETVLDRDLVPEVRGELPAYVRGSLVRTAPYRWVSGAFAATHWFDGLGLLYAFRLGDGAPRFAARSLSCDFARAIADDSAPTPGMFGTDMRRSFLRRLFNPIPTITDNTNVNILRMGPDLVALTEGPTQLRIDPETLETLGPVVYADKLHEQSLMLAHPHLDIQRKTVVGLATHIGPTTRLRFYEHAPASRTRVPIAEWATKRIPYVHSFGLSERHVVLIDHPTRFTALGGLWSNRGLADQFHWDGGETQLVVLPRDGSAPRTALAPSMFVFHIANTYDDGDDLVMDVAAHDDGSVVQSLSSAALIRQPKVKQARLLRLRIPRKGPVEVTELSSLRQEFPSIAYGTRNGREHSVVWGATAFPDADGRSYVVRVDVKKGETRKFDEPGYVFGEPIFVRDPARGDEEGVLLCVGSNDARGASCLFVLDATTLVPVARVEVGGLVPLGFHGSFVRT